MQTFLPFESFVESAQSLDRLRLGKQRVECLQILNTLTGKSNGWINHPIVKAWRGYEGWLIEYGLCICEEWVDQGYKDSVTDKIMDIAVQQGFSRSALFRPPPPWLGNQQLHSNYRALLVHKNPEWYRDRGWTEKPIEKLDWTLFEV